MKVLDVIYIGVSLEFICKVVYTMWLGCLKSNAAVEVKKRG